MSNKNPKLKLGSKLLFFDGAMGTMLQERGLKSGEAPELLNRTKPEIIKDIHRGYLNAGCDFITTNTFGANRLKFGKDCAELIRAAVNIAKEAIAEVGGKKRYVALDIGPTGKLLKPFGELEFEEAYDVFKEVAIIGEMSGADLAIIETMSDTYEVKAAILAVKENTSLPVLATMTFDEKGKALTGADILCMVALFEGLGVDCLGINCGLGPMQLSELFPILTKYSSKPVIVQPNAGLPVIRDGKTCYDVSPDSFAEAMRDFAKNGASVLGGCCGTTPLHIEKMIKLCENITPKPPVNKDFTVVSSYSKSVIIGERPVIIGERINPTGKKKFKEALKNNDIGYILNEAVSQKECGADILDVNVGLPEIDEIEMMKSSVTAIQSVENIPLQIDSSNPETIEAALRLYNGKALINSVNGKKESMEAIFPLVKKYGGVVVGLTLDENGIPSYAEGRFEIARKIVETAAKYGIDKKDIIIDTLTLTVSAQQKEAMETLKALKMVREKLGVNTVLGISNISFGLPQREIITSTFLALALNSGLNACIINPCSESVMQTIRAYNVLSGVDESCAEYIAAYSGQSGQTTNIVPQKTEPELKEIIIKGLKDEAYTATLKLLYRTEPLDIINNHLIPAFDEVGEKFEKGSFFLPQLMMSAEAAKNAFKAIEERTEGKKTVGRGKIVLATVKGDIHDIGKNIVKLLLENYGYDVIDLGKDVDIERIVDVVKRENIKLVGLSALMTTTVLNMEKTIKALRESSPECKIMVGGAVLNEDYAKMIGADFYAKDALTSIDIAGKVFG